jgi:integrase/recombinase XerD
VKHRIDDQFVLLRLGPGGPEGPVATYLRPFAGWLRQQGYKRDYVMFHLVLAASFSKWLKHKHTRMLGNRITSQHAARFLKWRYKRRRPDPHNPAAIRHFMEFLRSAKVIPAEKISRRQVTPTERCIQAYGEYLREERAVTKATIVNHIPFVRLFLKACLGSGPAKLSSMGATDVVRFVRRHAGHLGLGRAKIMTHALRSFLRYARYNGEVTLDLAAAVPTVANWSMSTIPRAIAPEQVRQLLASIDRRTPKGRRDYAILLLLARLGVRACEVVALELDDIDWGTGQLRVRGKGGRSTELPLPQDVGRAIAAYVRRGRPATESRRVFIRTRAPHRGFQNSIAVCTLVADALKRAGIKAATWGAHQFRHGLASEMLRHDASLAEIGDVLGHRHPDTTNIYAKVDLKALRSLAQPWPDM